jgi:hypothetical protein
MRCAAQSPAHPDGDGVRPRCGSACPRGTQFLLEGRAPRRRAGRVASGEATTRRRSVDDQCDEAPRASSRLGGPRSLRIPVRARVASNTEKDMITARCRQQTTTPARHNPAHEPNSAPTRTMPQEQPSGWLGARPGDLAVGPSAGDARARSPHPSGPVSGQHRPSQEPGGHQEGDRSQHAGALSGRHHGRSQPPTLCVHPSRSHPPAVGQAEDIEARAARRVDRWSIRAAAASRRTRPPLRP